MGYGPFWVVSNKLGDVAQSVECDSYKIEVMGSSPIIPIDTKHLKDKNMETKPCACCKDGKPGIGGGQNGYGYNRLEGESREWAVNNGFVRSEYCVRVKGGKRFSGENWQKIKCGDGRMGFSTRRRGQEKVHMEVGLDGQLKKKRNTLIRPKSARATASRRARRVDGSRVILVSLVTIEEIGRDPIAVAQQIKMNKKTKRAKNRNNMARRGYRRTIKMAA